MRVSPTLRKTAIGSFPNPIPRSPFRIRRHGHQRWENFVKALEPGETSPNAVFHKADTKILEEFPIKTSTEVPGYRHFKPMGHFSIYKNNEIQRAVEETLNYKLVFFAPVDVAARVKDAIFATGAGTLDGGKYTRCSFQTLGTAQYRAEDGALPTRGRLGKTHVEESVRVEILCHGRKTVKAAVRALLITHPFESPSYEVYKTEPGFLPHQCQLTPTLPPKVLSPRPRSVREAQLANFVKQKLEAQFRNADAILADIAPDVRPRKKIQQEMSLNPELSNENEKTKLRIERMASLAAQLKELRAEAKAEKIGSKTKKEEQATLVTEEDGSSTKPDASDAETVRSNAPDAVETGTLSIQSDAPSTETETLSAETETSNDEPTASNGKKVASTTEIDASSSETGTLDIAPNTSNTEPDALYTEYNASEVETGNLSIEPEPLNIEPEALSTETTTLSTEIETGALDIEPNLTDAEITPTAKEEAPSKA
ncbi:hypothetical protein ABW20_dc0103110 [Dactylellina cionopaga]|nr:hypothetical protein ABW20_dc0103110 [Dactylellina cionopaga]